jgi:sortase (surface protein transpeptidase)
MKSVSLVVATLAALLLTATASATAFLTIPALGIYHKPILTGDNLDQGPIWDRSTRPGQGKAMIIAGHDVTPVPGYGAHGPFYDVVDMKKGYLLEIEWYGKLFIYRGRANAEYHPAYDRNVVIEQGESVWIYSCWPRYTALGRQWWEGRLVAVRDLKHK